MKRLAEMALLSAVLAGALIAGAGQLGAQEPKAGRVYIVLWFDTEDYILPESDEAAIAQALRLRGSDAAELWCGARRVKDFAEAGTR